MKFITAHYNCANCNHDLAQPLFIKQGFTIVQCSNCNFVYVNPRISNFQLEKIYQNNYFENKDYGYYGYEQEQLLRKKNFERWLNVAKKYLTSEKLINALDIGCAAGYCLDVMRANGWEADGLELDENMCKELAKKGYNVHLSLLENFESTKRYSIITMFDVLEHIPNVDAVFKKLYKLTEDDGIVVMVTPNYNSLQRKLFGKKWFQFKPVEHIQYFTLESISSFAERNNFKIIYNSGCGQYADTNFLINRLRYYHFTLPAYILNQFFKILRLRNKFFYLNTGSLFVIFKKM